jgi:transcriptional regulator with XRE-family HTH domain
MFAADGAASFRALPIYVPLPQKRHHVLYGRDLRMARERRTIAVVRQSATAKDCPLAPPEQASVFARTLHRACLILGGIEPLAKHLEVSDRELSQWLRGEDKPPEPIFLRAVEVVLLHAGTGGRT